MQPFSTLALPLGAKLQGQVTGHLIIVTYALNLKSIHLAFTFKLKEFIRVITVSHIEEMDGIFEIL